MATVTIRCEETGDHGEIGRVVYAAFLNHPQHAPGALPTEHLIVDALRRAGALALSLVAEDGGEIIGHIACSSVLVNGEVSGWYGIGPLAVRPDRQGEG